MQIGEQVREVVLEPVEEPGVPGREDAPWREPEREPDVPDTERAEPRRQDVEREPAERGS